MTLPTLVYFCRDAGGAVKRLENEHVTADVVGKPLDVRSKSIDQWFVAACLSLLNIVEQIALPETAPPPVAKPPTAILRFLFPKT